MPVEDYVVGTGLTKRDRRRIKFSKPPTTEEREAFKDALKPRTFDRAVEDAEAQAIQVLEAEGLRTDGLACVAEMQSREWYADVIVSMVSRTRAYIPRVAAGRGDWADDLATAALNLGYLICEAKLKFEWEEDTIFGAETRESQRVRGGKRGEQQHREMLAKIERAQQLANELFAEGFKKEDVLTELEERGFGSADTLRRQIRKP